MVRFSMGLWIRWVAVLAAAYAVTGWLSTRLAISPGYATAIFPPAGIALVALLTGGMRLWPGVWLGSFLLNTGIAFASPSGLTARSATVAACIGLGAAMQTVAGTLLVRRLSPNYRILDDVPTILRFLGVGGPLACVVSPLVGVGSLWMFGIVSTENLPFSLCTWWAGDAIGVIIVAPLLLSILSRHAAFWPRRFLSIALPSVVAMAIVIVLFYKVSAWEQERVIFRFRETAARMTNGLQDHLKDYLHTVSSVRGFVAHEPQVSRSNFGVFARNLLTQYPCIQAVEWIPRVPFEERESREAEARQDGLTAYCFTEYDKDGRLVSAGRRAEYFPVFYVEPYKGNEIALGFDLASDPVRRQALKTARDGGRTTATAPLTLVQEKEGQYGFLVFDPVYGAAANNDSLKARRKALIGYALGVFQIGAMVNTAINAFSTAGIFMEIWDATPGEKRSALYRSSADTANQGGDFTSVTRLAVANRTWEIRFTARPGYIVMHRTMQAWLTLVGCLLFVGFLQIYLFAMTGRAGVAGQHNPESIAELGAKPGGRLYDGIKGRIREEYVHRMASANRDCIMTIDEDGIIELAGSAAECIFGWKAEELIGRNIATLMPDAYHRQNRQLQDHSLDTGMAKIPGANRKVAGLRRGGESFPVEISIHELHPGNRRIFAIFLRDVSHVGWAVPTKK